MTDGRISALKVVADGTTSRWVGDAHGACYTKRLSLGAHVIALEAEFNVRSPDTSHTRLLMLSIQQYGICSLSVACKASDMEMTHSDPVLQNALWLPKINDRGLFFNGNSYALVGPRKDFTPHRWALFGDKDGSLLASLTGLRLTLLGRCRLSKIEFFYRHRTRRPGTPARTVVLDLSVIPVDCFATSRSYILDIDGPGGERINKVEFRLGQDRPSRSRKVPILYKVSRFFQMEGAKLGKLTFLCTRSRRTVEDSSTLRLMGTIRVTKVSCKPSRLLLELLLRILCHRSEYLFFSYHDSPTLTTYRQNTETGRASLRVISAKVPNLD